MDTFATTAYSSATTQGKGVITLLPSANATDPTKQARPVFTNLFVDTCSVEFHPSLDLGTAEIGKATFRATLYKPNGEQEALDDLSTDPAIRAGGHELGDYLRRIERNPARAAAMAKARQRLAQSMSKQSDNESPTSLAALRLRAGLSQTQMAERMQTQQPAVARFERDPSNLGFLTLLAIASAVGCPVGDVANVIAAQLKATPQP